MPADIENPDSSIHFGRGERIILFLFGRIMLCRKGRQLERGWIIKMISLRITQLDLMLLTDILR
jgi:hypothetical protein